MSKCAGLIKEFCHAPSKEKIILINQISSNLVPSIRDRLRKDLSFKKRVDGGTTTIEDPIQKQFNSIGFASIESTPISIHFQIYLIDFKWSFSETDSEEMNSVYEGMESLFREKGECE
jgi:hypothetical protein